MPAVLDPALNPASPLPPAGPQDVSLDEVRLVCRFSRGRPWLGAGLGGPVEIQFNAKHIL